MAVDLWVLQQERLRKWEELQVFCGGGGRGYVLRGSSVEAGTTLKRDVKLPDLQALRLRSWGLWVQRLRRVPGLQRREAGPGRAG